MYYIVTFVWAILLGQIVGFLGSALSKSPYDFKMTLIASIIAAVFVIIIGKFAVPDEKKSVSNDQKHA
ncbi:MAG TPA: YjzD family protein [Enterococcus sp.]|nr:YjzD family protein [Enterococcus sp.]HPR81490.1 YjzD family protein [Enterococcus sp.]